jgi:DNA-binding GntR family transcriptional regulator
MERSPGDSAPADGVPQSAVDGVYDSLLTAIVEMQVGVGAQLSQNKLAAQLGVSRTPVREALLRLERDGLVHRTADLGFVVAAMTPDEVNEACDVLELLDSFVYRQAASSLASDEIEELRDLAATLVSNAESGDTDAWTTADRRYHDIVMRAADNRFVAEYLKQLRRRVQRFWLQRPLTPGGLQTCSQDHLTLAVAMAETNEALLEETVRSHIARMRRNVLELLERAAPLLGGDGSFAPVR